MAAGADRTDPRWSRWDLAASPWARPAAGGWIWRRSRDPSTGVATVAQRRRASGRCGVTWGVGAWQSVEQADRDRAYQPGGGGRSYLDLLAPRPTPLPNFLVIRDRIFVGTANHPPFRDEAGLQHSIQPMCSRGHVVPGSAAWSDRENVSRGTKTTCLVGLCRK
jgi:hypothetical protein